MAIFQKAYRGYFGELSLPASRGLVIFRYSLSSILGSRIFLAFMVACLVPSFVLMCTIYARHNLEFLMNFEVPLTEFAVIDAGFFADYMMVPQLFAAFVLIMFVGPTLISPDLRNNALSLYMSRPISKLNYVFGKLLVLLVLCSAITWVPGVLLILFHAYLAGGNWLADNIHLPFATFLASFIWILSLSVFSLAISAMVKWAPVARLSFFAFISILSIFGKIIEQVTGSWQGNIFSLYEARDALIQALFKVNNFSSMPGSAAFMVFAVLMIASGFVLYRRIRGFEVVS